MQNADPKTFEIIDAWHTKDSLSVYYAGARIDGAESETFEVMKGNYAKDSSSAYYKGKRVEGADVKTFEVDLYGQMARDKNTNYVEGKPVTAKGMINEDIISSPGFEKAEGAVAIPVVPFGLEDIEIQEMYPMGL